MVSSASRLRARTAPRRPSRSARIVVAADWAPIRAFDPIVRQDPAAVYGDLLSTLRDAELRIVNCECALTRATREVWKSGAVFKGAPTHAAGLAVVPFDVACLANNHVLDFDVRGLRETLHVLERHRIRTVGAGLNEAQAYAPLTVNAGAVRVHLVNFSEGEDLTSARHGPGVFGWDIARVGDIVRERKRRGGLVIAIGHCGLEYVPFPPPYVVSAFHAIADAGADAVIGHHPHVPQGVEWYGGKPILYSLGNFVFYQPNALHHRKTGFFVTLDAAGAEITGVELHPYRITDTGLRALSAPETDDFRRSVRAVSKPFEQRDGAARAWDAYLAYYGRNGFVAEARGILDRMEAEPRKAAAMFRNRVTTMQHVELWQDVLTRIVEGETRRYPARAFRVVQEWFTRTVDATDPAT